ncbi:MAG: hypothetical protein ACRDLY_09875 [Thermoleophilaceae bacterium]
MRRLAIVVLPALLALPAPAVAGVTLTEFKVEPSNLQAGGHPSVKITQAFSYSNTTDDAQDTFVRLAPGLLGNPQNAALCTGEQMRSSAGCPPSAKVGSVVVTAGLIDPILHLRLSGLTVPGTVYNLRPTGGEPARLGLALQALGGLSRSYLEAAVRLRPGPDGIGLETLFEKQPRDAGLDIQIERVELTFDAAASKGSFMRMPTSCATGVSLARVNSYEAPAALSERTFPLTPTGCDALGFAPTATGSLGAPDQLLDGDFPPLSTTLRFDPEEAALNRAEVTLPTSLAPNQAALMRVCLRPQAEATACPESSRVGTAIIDSPLQAEPVRGPVYLAFNTPAPLPGLMVVLPPPVDLRIDAVVETGSFGVRNVFPSNPDLPLRSFTLEFGGGPSGILQLTDDLCAPRTPTAIAVKLTSHSGRVREFSQDLATPGCDPRARITLRKNGRRYTLAAVLEAARRGPDIRSAKLGLPKPLKRGRRTPRVHVDGRRVRVRRARRAVKPKLGGGARRVKIVWRGLRARRKVRRTVVVPLTMVDDRGKRFTPKVRVARG